MGPSRSLCAGSSARAELYRLGDVREDVDARLESPAVLGLDVDVLVPALILDRRRIAADADREQRRLAGRTARGRRNHVRGNHVVDAETEQGLRRTAAVRTAAGRDGQFVAADGYERPELWTDEGWRWVQAACVRHPTFWIQEDREYRYRAMFDVLALPLHWPVEVNFHEASAYCRFLGEGARLPTEAEFRRISDEVQPEGGDPVFTDDFNLNLCYGSPCAVGSLATAASPRGIQDIQGNVWCWLADDFNPLPGFRTHPWYDDFSEPFFTPDHAMLLGGSWASLGTSASRYYRLWFRRQFIQHAGFRVVRDLDGPSLP